MTRGLGSLTNRLFLMCVVLSTASIGAAMLFVNLRLAREHDRTMATRQQETLTFVEQQRRLEAGNASRLARLVADLPKLKAAIATADPPTVAPIVASYREEIGADELTVLDADGRELYSSRSVTVVDRGLLEVVSAPIVLGVDAVERLGLLSVGHRLDHDRARELATATGSELAFVTGSRVVATSLGPSAVPVLERGLGQGTSGALDVGSTRYTWSRHRLETPPIGGASAGTGPELIVLTSTAEADATLRSVRLALAVIAILTALAASVASYAVARTITRPLARLRASMREVSLTGDLSRTPTRSVDRAWNDEDVRELSGTFDAMTAALARFQQQAVERDRLTALGRLSTVIAHEIRNPLMIVRGALRGLRGRDDPAVAEAAIDIEEQVQRLDRVVNDVLDFTRPVQLDVTPSSLHAICRDAVTACVMAEPEPEVRLALAPDTDAIRTDPDRLRTVLVNVITNARNASRAAAIDAPPSPVMLGTRRATEQGREARGVGAGAVVIEVRDTGIGIDQTALAHVFEPYFTTQRTGTGLGLAIARNIVEGLGGRIGIDSRKGEGTTLWIVLPDDGRARSDSVRRPASQESRS